MRKYFIDTNIFLRFFVKDNNKQSKECKKVFTALENKKIKGYISSVVVMEIYFTLRSFYNFPRKKANKFIGRVLKTNNLYTVDDYNYLKALELLKTNVKFADCLIACLDFFEDTKSIIISYDKDFDKLGIKRLEPQKVEF